MGRELKRVALDFAWPLHKPYVGYINPEYKAVKCESCDGSGCSPRAAYLFDVWYGYVPFDPKIKNSKPFQPTDPSVIAFAERNVNRTPDYYGTGPTAIYNEAVRLAELFNSSWSHHLDDDDVSALLAAGRLMHFTHVYIPSEGWKPVPYVAPSAREVNEWSISGFGHDSINASIVVNAMCEREGIACKCAECNGEGNIWASEEDKQRYENWKPFEPPEGPGYQIWENVSEGSPISPVFADSAELALYMAMNGTEDKLTAEDWLKFILGDGWAPTAIITEYGVVNGVKGL